MVTRSGSVTMEAPEGSVESDAFRAFLDRLDSRGMAVDSLLIHAGGRTVLEHHRWPYRADRPRMLHSATKSFVGTAVGFAIDEGLLSLDDRLVDLFPERAHLGGELQSEITVADLLTMRTGHATGPSGATWRRLTSSWIDEYLALPVVARPGHDFIYSSATSHLLSAIVQRASGVTVSEYLRTRLFDPLGFTTVDWSRDPEGFCSGGNGLGIRPSDFLKWGVLHLEDGRWEGRQVLPAGWVETATRVRVPDASLRWNGIAFESAEASEFADRVSQGYGYQLWTTEDGIFFASGIFGQLCVVSPQDGVVVVTTGSMPDELGAELLTEVVRHLLPAFRPDRAAHRTANVSAQTRLEEREIPTPLRRPLSIPTLNATYVCDPNDDGLVEISFESAGVGNESELRVRLRDDRGEHTVRCGVGYWAESATTVTGWRLHHSYQPDSAVVVAGAEWLSRTVLALYWNFVESPFRDVVVIYWNTDDEIGMLRTTNVNSGLTARPPITARRQSSERPEATSKPEAPAIHIKEEVDQS